jgi:hypothetical protein
MVPEHRNRSSLVEWQLILESIVEGSTTLPIDAICH